MDKLRPKSKYPLLGPLDYKFNNKLIRAGKSDRFLHLFFQIQCFYLVLLVALILILYDRRSRLFRIIFILIFKLSHHAVNNYLTI